MLLQVGAFAASEKPGAGEVGWWRRTFGTLSWDEIQYKKMSPEEILKVVRSHVNYRSETVDTWSGGRETWQRGYGDCEDIAACIVELCRLFGYEAWIQVFLPPGSLQGHAVAMGRLDGKIWIADKSFFLVETAEEAKTVIGREMRWKKGAIRSMPLAVIRDTSGTAASDSQ